MPCGIQKCILPSIQGYMCADHICSLNVGSKWSSETIAWTKQWMHIFCMVYQSVIWHASFFCNGFRDVNYACPLAWRSVLVCIQMCSFVLGDAWRSLLLYSGRAAFTCPQVSGIWFIGLEISHMYLGALFSSVLWKMLFLHCDQLMLFSFCILRIPIALSLPAS